MSDADYTEIEFLVSRGEILEQNQVVGSDEYKLRWKHPLKIKCRKVVLRLQQEA